ncbi:hypothetical protein OE88DRAFT_433557 [Heliocybe sulcata]|uniref:Uncharacterized protein n=1 Tax=Heliocybe sulcata TaxID=5364 RepID=A0A5C3MUD0_9AGAM|nr:hypothetical protein OE88DRAFT_433557 [Heliocybe sulcata]
MVRRFDMLGSGGPSHPTRHKRPGALDIPSASEEASFEHPNIPRSVVPLPDAGATTDAISSLLLLKEQPVPSDPPQSIETAVAAQSFGTTSTSIPLPFAPLLQRIPTPTGVRAPSSASPSSAEVVEDVMQMEPTHCIPVSVQDWSNAAIAPTPSPSSGQVVEGGMQMDNAHPFPVSVQDRFNAVIASESSASGQIVGDCMQMDAAQPVHVSLQAPSNAVLASMEQSNAAPSTSENAISLDATMEDATVSANTDSVYSSSSSSSSSLCWPRAKFARPLAKRLRVPYRMTSMGDSDENSAAIGKPYRSSVLNRLYKRQTQAAMQATGPKIRTSLLRRASALEAHGVPRMFWKQPVKSIQNQDRSLVVHIVEEDQDMLTMQDMLAVQDMLVDQDMLADEREANSEAVPIPEQRELPTENVPATQGLCLNMPDAPAACSQGETNNVQASNLPEESPAQNSFAAVVPDRALSVPLEDAANLPALEDGVSSSLEYKEAEEWWQSADILDDDAPGDWRSFEDYLKRNEACHREPRGSQPEEEHPDAQERSEHRGLSTTYANNTSNAPIPSVEGAVIMSEHPGRPLPSKLPASSAEKCALPPSKSTSVPAVDQPEEISAHTLEDLILHSLPSSISINVEWYAAGLRRLSLTRRRNKSTLSSPPSLAKLALRIWKGHEGAELDWWSLRWEAFIEYW